MTVEQKTFWQEHSTLTLFAVILLGVSAWVGGALMIPQIARIGAR